MKYTALANVRQLSTLLRPSIDIIGVGGISSGMDAFEMILCGAKAVQIGTKHWKEGSVVFDRVAGELEEIMRRKKYTSIEQFRGKLKPYTASSSSSSSSSDEEGGVASSSKSKPVDSELLILRVVALIMTVIIAILLKDNTHFQKYFLKY